MLLLELLQILKIHLLRPGWTFSLSEPLQHISLLFLVILRSSLAIPFAKSYSIFLSGTVFLACFHENPSQQPLSVAVLWKNGHFNQHTGCWPRAPVIVNIQPKSLLKRVNLWLVIHEFPPLLMHFSLISHIMERSDV